MSDSSDDEAPELVTLDDGQVLPLKKTICVPYGNKQVKAGRRACD